MYFPSEKGFVDLTRQGNLIPVYREISGDMETPVSAYYKIATRSKYSFLLESVEGEEKVARFSFLARDPELILRTKGKKAEIICLNKGKKSKEVKEIVGTPLDLIRDILKKYEFVQVPGLPRFCGGMVGFLSYDTVRFFERLPQKTKDDLKLPDTVLVLASELVIFDHLNHKIKILKNVYVDPKSQQKEKIKAYQTAIKVIDQLANELTRPLGLPKNKNRRKSPLPIKLKIRSNFSQPEFEEIVRKAKEEILAGEIIQVVLSQRFEVGLKTEPFNLYRALRALNPSPYMYFLNFDEVKIVGSSPELLVRCEDGVVDTRPIAGTRPRGKDETQDEAFAKDLLNDPKERAEHIMLVDLGRNDLGRVCKRGTVKVSEFMKIEKYSHVMHIVSNVKGKLADDKDGFDVLQAAFPAGTVSGAPKIRAMEIIEDLEKVTRGPYAGCIGYFSFSGNLDTCITIRTMVVSKDKAYLQAGAGIVADSNPASEYMETLNKARAQLRAIEIAHSEASNI